MGFCGSIDEVITVQQSIEIVDIAVYELEILVILKFR
jgi:hypothetical protein